MADTAYLILDTNILLHFKQPDQIDWPALCRADRVELVVCPQMMTELSEKKDMHPNKQLRARARDREAWLFAGLRERDRPIRPQVFLRRDTRETRAKVRELGLDVEVNDNSLIALAVMYVYDGHSAVVTTGDGGLRLKLEDRGMPFLWLDDELRQETESDPERRRADQAEKEVLRLRNRLPVLSVEPNEPWEVSRQRGYGDVDTYVREQLAVTEQAFSQNEGQRYRMVMIHDDRHRQEVQAVTRFLVDRHRWLTVTEGARRISVKVKNTGTATATNTRLRLFWPQGLLLYGSGGFGQPPRAPFYNRRLEYVPQVVIREELADIVTSYMAVDGKPSIDRGAGVASLNWSSVQHDSEVRSIDFWLLATSSSATGRTYIRAELLCEETGEKQHGNIPVDVVEVDEPR